MAAHGPPLAPNKLLSVPIPPRPSARFLLRCPRCVRVPGLRERRQVLSAGGFAL